MAPPNGQDVHISRGIRPTPPILLAGGEGWRGEKRLDSRIVFALRQFPRLAGGVAIPPCPASIRLGTIHVRGHSCEDAPCLRRQNAYTVPQAVDPRPTSSAFSQRRPTAEAKGGILPDQQGELRFSRGLGCWGARFL